MGKRIGQSRECHIFKVLFSLKCQTTKQHENLIDYKVGTGIHHRINRTSLRR